MADEIAGFQGQNFNEGKILNFFFPDKRTLQTPVSYSVVATVYSQTISE